MSRNRPNSSLQIPLPEPFSIDLALAAVGASSFGTPFAAVGPDHVRRLLYLAGQTAVVDFTFCRASRELQVTSQSLVDAAPLRSVANHLWGLDDDLPACYESLGADPQLRPLLHQYAGLRMVRAACLYEALVSAILGQQISVASAQSIRRRLIGALGDRLAVQGEVIAAYPLPDKLLQAGSEGLHALGITRQKARYLLAMAEQASTGELEPDRFALLSDS